MGYVVKIGEVVSVDDEVDGWRIKVKLPQDGGKHKVVDIPYSNPLLPKMIHILPKVGEAVLVICSEIGNTLSNRYYIGPIISQPQKLEFDSYLGGSGRATSLLQGGSMPPLEKISNFNETIGAFPNKDDIAILGRSGEDIILKDGEIDLRCGIRVESYADNELQGKCHFNSKNPSYIQMKYNRGKESVINLVADKINLLSHKDDEQYNLHDNKTLISDDTMNEINRKLHGIPYGDLLVDALNKIRDAIENHSHPWADDAACRDKWILAIDDIDFNSLVSNNVKTS